MTIQTERETTSLSLSQYTETLFMIGKLGSSSYTLSPRAIREKFCIVAESKAESLAQQLKSMEKSRSTACRKKFSSLELTGTTNEQLFSFYRSLFQRFL